MRCFRRAVWTRTLTEDKTKQTFASGYFAAVKLEGSAKNLKAKKGSRVPPACWLQPDRQLSWLEWAALLFLRAWTGERTTEGCARVLSWAGAASRGDVHHCSADQQGLRSARVPPVFLRDRRDGSEGGWVVVVVGGRPS